MSDFSDTSQQKGFQQVLAQRHQKLQRKREKQLKKVKATLSVLGGEMVKAQSIEQHFFSDIRSFLKVNHPSLLSPSPTLKELEGLAYFHCGKGIVVHVKRFDGICISLCLSFKCCLEDLLEILENKIQCIAPRKIDWGTVWNTYELTLEGNSLPFSESLISWGLKNESVICFSRRKKLGRRKLKQQKQ